MRWVLSAAAIAAVVFAGLLLMFVPDDAYAHGNGLTLTATTSVGYVDVDYSDYSVYARETGKFDIKLFKDPERTQPITFSRVWVRVVQRNDLPEGETVFSGWIAKPSFGPTGFSITLPDPGAYVLMVRYVNGDTAVDDASLPFTVLRRTDPSPLDRSFFLGSAAGFGAAFFVLLGLVYGRRFVIQRRR